MTTTRTTIIEGNRIDISDAIASAPAATLPEGWTPQILADVEAGRISVRRARQLAAGARA